MSVTSETMPYFVFHPHVQVVRGIKSAAIHNLFSAQIFWIRESQIARACSLVASGKSLSASAHVCGLSKGALSKYLQGFVRIGLGAFTAHRATLEPYRSKLLRSQATTRDMYRVGGTLTLEIADRCPYHCRWCASKTAFSADACACGVWGNQRGLVPLERLISAIEELHFIGVDKMVIRGGDPFLNPGRLWALLDTASRLEMMCEIHATGNLIQKAGLRHLKGKQVHMVLLAAAPDRDQFETDTGLPGSFNAFLNAVKALQDTGIPFSTKVPISLASPEKGERTVIWARELGAARVLAFIHTCDSEDPADALRAALSTASPQAFAADLDRFYTNGENQYCFDNAYFITADGLITPCIGWRQAIADLNQTEMEIVLREEMLEAMPVARKDCQACRGCEFRFGCRACLVRTIQQRGTAEARHWTCRYDPATSNWQ